MKTIKILMLCFGMLLLSGCTFSIPDEWLALFEPTASPDSAPPGPASATPSRTATPSVTPTLPTSTFTPTPTVLGGMPTPIRTNTATATPTIIQLVQGGVLTPTTAIQGFVSIILSEEQLYWGDCDGPHETTVRAQVSEPSKVYDVTIFVRLQYKNLDIYTDWDSGTTMIDNQTGTFTHVIESELIPGYTNFPDAYIQFQIVSTGHNRRVLDRTPVFTDDLALNQCE